MSESGIPNIHAYRGSGTEPVERRMDSLDDNSVVVPPRMTSDTVFSLDLQHDRRCTMTPFDSSTKRSGDRPVETEYSSLRGSRSSDERNDGYGRNYFVGFEGGDYSQVPSFASSADSGVGESILYYPLPKDYGYRDRRVTSPAMPSRRSPDIHQDYEEDYVEDNYNPGHKGYGHSNPNSSSRNNCLNPPDSGPYAPYPVYDNYPYGVNSGGSRPYPDTMSSVPVYSQRTPPAFVPHPDYQPRMSSSHPYPVYASEDYESRPSYYPPRRMQIDSMTPLSNIGSSSGYSKPRHNRHSQPSPSMDSSMSYHAQRSDSHNRRKSSRRLNDRPASNGRYSSHIPSSLSDYEDSILDLALQQKGCRMLQRELDLKGVSMVDVIYRAIGDQINLLVMDQYGNYLFQKLIDLSNDDQKREVLRRVQMQLAVASKSDQGTRCVQNLIANCKQPDMMEMIIQGLEGHTVELCADSNGNHVISKCLEIKPEELRYPLYEHIIAHCSTIAQEKYGCSVIIKCTNIMTDPYRSRLISAIESCVVVLIENSYSNYIIQNIINTSPAEESQRFCRYVLGHVVEFSMQKCSSNVVECAIKNGDDSTRDAIIDELLEYDSMLTLLEDQYANYVVQKALVLTTGEKKKELAYAIRPYLDKLKESRSGQFIIPKIMDMLRDNDE